MFVNNINIKYILNLTRLIQKIILVLIVLFLLRWHNSLIIFIIQTIFNSVSYYTLLQIRSHIF